MNLEQYGQLLMGRHSEGFHCCLVHEWPITFLVQESNSIDQQLQVFFQTLEYAEPEAHPLWKQGRAALNHSCWRFLLAVLPAALP